MENAAKASASALCFELYAAAAEDGRAGGRAGGCDKPASTPAFVLQLRAGFSPWPLELSAPVTHPAEGEVLEHTTRLALHCACAGMPSEPHLRLSYHLPKMKAMVLVDVRLDGLIEIVSNSSKAAYKQLHKLLLSERRELKDFHILLSSWQRDGRNVRAFEALACKRFLEWEEERERGVERRYAEERSRQKAKAELLSWAKQIGLSDSAELLTRAGIDLQSLPFLNLLTYRTDDDMHRLGVNSVGSIRKLVGLRRQQLEEGSLREQLSQLQEEHAALREDERRGREERDKARVEGELAKKVLARLETQLASERLRCSQLSDALRMMEAQLAAATELAGSWQRKAGEFATDSEALQMRLQQ
ncbi:MAG: hypothetical protein SGPRY_006958, partial [Prymnesium sp.]